MKVLSDNKEKTIQIFSGENFLFSPRRSLFIMCPRTFVRDLVKVFGKSSQEATTNGLNVENYCSIVTSEDYIL